MTTTPPLSAPDIGETPNVAPPEKLIAEMLGGGSSEQQLEILRGMILRLQVPLIPIVVMYDPIDRRASVYELSGKMPHEALISALSTAQQEITQAMLSARTAAEETVAEAPKTPKRGRR